MNIKRSVKEVLKSSYYRRRPVGTLRYGYAKWLLARHRVDDPLKILDTCGVERATANSGLDRWLPLLEEMGNRVHQKSKGQGGASSQDGLVLYLLVRALNPEYVIETGVAAGVSTSWIAAALIENGKGSLYSLELPPKESKAISHADGSTYDWAESGVGWAIPEEIRNRLGDRHTLILGDVRETLPPLLDRLPCVDLFFHDDLHTPDHQLWEYRLVWPHLRTGGVLVSDDVNYAWIQFCRENCLDAATLANVDRLAAIRRER